jgi:hypothetical protein
MRALAATAALGTTLITANITRAAPEAAQAPEDPTREEVEAWLASRALPPSIDPDASELAPPPEPRRPGIVLEGSAGALGHLGEMRFISPISPMLQLRLGWEPARWIMLSLASDVAFGRTTHARPPPEPRAYVLHGAAFGVRATWDPADLLGLFAQIEGGVAWIDSPALATLGFRDAASVAPYFGGSLGVKWYQVSPHVAIIGQGGVRVYQQTFRRDISAETPLAWTGQVGLAYTFF